MDHIIINDKSHSRDEIYLECEHCGATETVDTLGISISFQDAVIEVFQNLHSSCEKKE